MPLANMNYFKARTGLQVVDKGYSIGRVDGDDTFFESTPHGPRKVGFEQAMDAYENGSPRANPSLADEARGAGANESAVVGPHITLGGLRGWDRDTWQASFAKLKEDTGVDSVELKKLHGGWLLLGKTYDVVVTGTPEARAQFQSALAWEIRFYKATTA